MPLAALADTWESWRLKHDLNNRYTLSALATRATDDDRNGTKWWPADCSKSERRLIGIQLAQIDEFANWPCLQSYRQGPQGVILRNGTPPAKKVKAIVAAVVSSNPDASDGPKVEALNFASTSNEVLRTVGEATEAFLTKGVPWLVLTFLFTGTFWFLPFWLTVTSLFLWQGGLNVGIVAFLFIPPGAVVFFSWPAWKWASYLRRSVVYLSIDRERGQTINGESFGVPACLAIVAALAELFPIPRGVWRRLVRALAEGYVFRKYTGVVTRRGNVTEVEQASVLEKIEAMRAAGVTEGYFPKANGPFAEPWVRGVRSLTNLARQMMGLPNWRVAVNVGCLILFFGGAWFWPQNAQLTGGWTDYGEFLPQGNAFQAVIPSNPGWVTVTVSRSWRPRKLQVIVEGGTAWFDQRHGWNYEQTVPIGADNEATFLGQFLKGTTSGRVTLLLVDHCGKICDSRALHLIIR